MRTPRLPLRPFGSVLVRPRVRRQVIPELGAVFRLGAAGISTARGGVHGAAMGLVRVSCGKQAQNLGKSGGD